MRCSACLWTASALIAVSIGLTACGTEKYVATKPVADAPTTITIDPSVGETFAPPPANAAPAMTAAEAWAAYTQVDTSYSSSAIPSNVSVVLGLLTLPTGPTGPNGTEGYTANNELVYGFSWHNCPASRNPNAPTLPSNPCVEWNFLDASTGKQIDETWQMPS